MSSIKRTETKAGGVSDGYLALFPLRTARAFSSDPIKPVCTGHQVIDAQGAPITAPLPESLCDEIVRALYVHQYEMQAETDGQREQLLCKITIPLDPPSKKNSMQVVNNKFKHPILIPNAKYTRTLNDIRHMGKTIFDYIAPGVVFPLDCCVRIVAHYYRDSHRRIDGTNIESAVCDILVSNGTITDDDIRHVHDTDGRRVWYDKTNPRMEIWIFAYVPNDGMKKAP